MAEAPEPAAWTPHWSLPDLPGEAARAAIAFIEGMPGNLEPEGYHLIVGLWTRVITEYNRWAWTEGGVDLTPVEEAQNVRLTLLAPVFERLLSQLPTLVPAIINAETAVELARHILTACKITDTTLMDGAYAPIETVAPDHRLELLNPLDRARQENRLVMPNLSWSCLSSIYRGQPNESQLGVLRLLSAEEVDAAIRYYDDPSYPGEPSCPIVTR